jgi:hypothetical protein
VGWRSWQEHQADQDTVLPSASDAVGD